MNNHIAILMAFDLLSDLKKRQRFIASGANSFDDLSCVYHRK